MSFHPSAFVENLKYMGIGMLGVFMIIATYVIGYFTTPRENKISPDDK